MTQVDEVARELGVSTERLRHFRRRLAADEYVHYAAVRPEARGAQLILAAAEGTSPPAPG